MSRDPGALAGTRLGEWSVDKKLGEGAMGAVYRARRDDGALAALKVMKPHLAEQADGRARFVREAKVIARIDSEHCCRSLGDGETDGIPWLALEFIDGKSLEAVLKLRGALSPDEAVDYARQMLLGLEAAHAVGVFHRDVKLQNAILTEGGAVKLVDFGLARRRDESMALTAEGMLMGTPHYMSPEQCRGETVDARSDIYAVGACLFHMLTGRTPFQAPSLMLLLRKHLEERPPPLKSFRPDAPAGLDGFIARVMRKDPADRPQTATAAIEALDEAAGRGRRAAGKREPARPARPAAPARDERVDAPTKVEAPPAEPPEAARTRARPVTGERPVVQLEGATDRTVLEPPRPAPGADGRRSSSTRAALPEPARVYREPDKHVLPKAQAKVAPPRGPDLLRLLIAGGAGLVALALARTGFKAGGIEQAWAAIPVALVVAWRAYVMSARLGSGEVKGVGRGYVDSLQAARDALARGDARGAAAQFEELRMKEDAAGAWTRCGEHRRAAQLYRELQRWEQAGEAYARAGEPLAAVEAFKAAGALELAAEALEKGGRPDEAARLLVERAAELEARRSKEQLPMRVARIDAELAKLAERACKLYQSLGQPVEGARLMARIGRHRDAAELYLEAGDRGAAVTELLAAGDKARAAEVHERAGDVVAAARIRAGVAEAKGDRKGAAAELERAGDPLGAARLFEAVGDLLRAAEAYDRGGEKGRAATLFEREGKALRAAELYERAERHADAARCFRSAGDGRRAAAALTRAGDLLGAGVALMDAGLPREALAELRRIPAGSPDHAAAKARIAALEEVVGHAAPPSRASGRQPAAGETLAPDARASGRVARAPSSPSSSASTASPSSGRAPPRKDAELTIGDGVPMVPRGPQDPAATHMTYLGSKPRPPGALERTTLGGEAIDDAGPTLPPRPRGAEAPTSLGMDLGATAPGASAPADDDDDTKAIRKTGVAAGAAAWVGRVVDRYRVLDVLGEGAFARVFRAEHVHLERPAALKVLKPEHASRPEVAKAFLAEAKTVSRIRHPGIVEVHDFGSVDDTCYMALELVDGEPLRQAIVTRAPLPLAQVRDLGQQLLAAVAAAHQGGVVHRDLKPENVLLDRQGRLKVLDFGMARAFWGHGPQSGFAGTPRYAAPEQARLGEIDARADQYAAALIIYELLAGELPFRSDTPQGWLAQHLTTPPAPPSTKRAGLPKAWDAALLRALEKVPNARYPDVNAFAAVLASLPC